MTQHTPGPWEIDSGDTPILIHGPMDTDTDGCPDTVAHVHVHADGSRWAYPAPVAVANARLIAAAPDMLEALRAFLRCPSIGSDRPGSSTIVVQDFNLRAARAAIAKATGE